VGLFSSSKSSTVNETNNEFYDQRSVIDAGGGIVGQGINVDRSQAFDYDSTSNWFQDSSNRSSTTVNTNTYGTDPGVLRLGQLNSEFLSAAAAGQSDTVRLLTSMGTDTVRASGGAATDLFGRAFSNTATAWENTLEAGTTLMGQVLGTADRTAAAAQGVATAAISSFQPSENKSSDTMKWVGLAAVALVGLLLMRKG
jgi:hypothetical protein